jgi:hypothetical protein
MSLYSDDDNGYDSDDDPSFAPRPSDANYTHYVKTDHANMNEEDYTQADPDMVNSFPMPHGTQNTPPGVGIDTPVSTVTGQQTTSLTVWAVSLQLGCQLQLEFVGLIRFLERTLLIKRRNQTHVGQLTTLI